MLVGKKKERCPQAFKTCLQSLASRKRASKSCSDVRPAQNHMLAHVKHATQWPWNKRSMRIPKMHWRNIRKLKYSHHCNSKMIPKCTQQSLNGKRLTKAHHSFRTCDTQFMIVQQITFLLQSRWMALQWLFFQPDLEHAAIRLPADAPATGVLCSRISSSCTVAIQYARVHQAHVYVRVCVCMCTWYV